MGGATACVESILWAEFSLCMANIVGREDVLGKEFKDWEGLRGEFDLKRLCADRLVYGIEAPHERLRE